MKRRICIVTGSRADYGLLRPIIDEIKNDPDMTMQLIVTGMHLSEDFGLTYSEIKRDGYPINERVDISLDSDSPVGIAKSLALAVKGCAEAYRRLRPHILIVLGDRFEIFGAAAAAHIARIPIAHIQGGELTEGAYDDAFRHSITKMSQFHFTATAEYRKRVIQLGERPNRVFDVGAPGLDNIKRLDLLAREEIERELNFKFGRHNLLVTFHSATLEDNAAGWQFKNLLYALDGLNQTRIIFTKTNADTGGRIINAMIDRYVARNKGAAAAYVSMGRLKYLSTMRFVDAVVGNSSSGIIEAPSLKIGTINIGDRQKGRAKAKSVIDCQPTTESITRAFRKLYSGRYQRQLRHVKNSYGDGRAAKRIKDILKKTDLENIIKKSFYDV